MHRMHHTLMKGLTAFICLVFLTAWKSHHGAPEPSFLQAGGIGVSNLEASLNFYIKGAGMTLQSQIQRDNRIEVVLNSADDKGSALTLMQFTDNVERAYDRNPGKLVFYAKDVNAFAESLVEAGGQLVLPPAPQEAFGGALVGFARDPDNNLVEMVGYPQATNSFLSAFGVGVSNLDAARDFYVNVMGLKEQTYLEIPGQYNEYILESVVPGSSALVLMNWTNGSDRNYLNNPVKLEFATGVPANLAKHIKLSRNTVNQFPRPAQELNNELVGYARDKDGNVLELRRSNKSYLDAAAIGVPDIDAAVSFYKSALGLQEVKRRIRHNRRETVMAPASGRGSSLVLMQFNKDDKVQYENLPGKLVFYTKDPDAVTDNLLTAGGQVLLPPTPQPDLGGVEVAFARDVHGNLIELVGIPDVDEPFLAAFGIGASDLEAAKAFYTSQFGFKVSQFLSTPSYDEYILEAEGGSALVLMHWTNGNEKPYKDNPVKLEIRTLSPLGMVASMRQSKVTVRQLPRRSRETGMLGETVAFAEDDDGNLLEILQAPWSNENSTEQE